MRQITRKGLMTVAAATGVIAATGGHASADSGAQGAATHSPGVLSGNSVQAPVHAPVDVCGNTVNVVGVLNPSTGNTCGHEGGGAHDDDGYDGYGEHGSGGARADGHSGDSSGIASGNNVQAPVDAPVNVCGNTVNVVGVGNSTVGNECGNGSSHPVPPGGGYGNPSGPGDSGLPGNSGNPGGQGHPANPGSPGNPLDPGSPGNPVEPGRSSGGPGQPGGPVRPGELRAAAPGGGQGHVLGAQALTRPQGTAQLARTGSELPLGLALPVGAGALLGGALLYRKARAAS